MPEHCLPRNFEYERTVPWRGGAIMSDTDAPVSFLVRGTLPRSSPPAEASEGAPIEPRGLPPPRLKTPPPPLRYRPKQRPSDFDVSMLEPHEIVEMGGCTYWYKNGRMRPMSSTDNERPEPRIGMPKRKLEQPIPGVSKPPRGRHVPKKGAEVTPDRRHICPVQVCGKAFKKRDHLNRHIRSLHQHEQSHMCPVPDCDKTFTRFDNYIRHMHKHQSHREEIFACSPEDGYKGVHLGNPIVLDPESANIKPFANIAIPPLPLNLWLFRERMRMSGADLPDVGDCARYFRQNPDERESALRGDPKWQWAMPPPGPDFTIVDSRCMTGTFRLNVRSDNP